MYELEIFLFKTDLMKCKTVFTTFNKMVVSSIDLGLDKSLFWDEMK